MGREWTIELPKLLIRTEVTMELMPEIIFSTIFVLVGSLVFHLSSMISGHDIFRETPLQIALIGAMVVGLVVFLLSPIGFISMFPENFVNKEIIEGGDKNSLQQWLKVKKELMICGNKKSGIEEINQNIFEDVESWKWVVDRRELYRFTFPMILSWSFLIPFLLASIGLGLIFGCMTSLDARISFLLWIRRKGLIHFDISSYSKSWDSFLRQLKKQAQIKITTEKEIIEGWLEGHSIRNELCAIRLSHYKVTERIGENTGAIKEESAGQNSSIIIIIDPHITKIESSPNSFNRHKDYIPHESQALYIIASAFGFLLVTIALCLTKQVLEKNGFGNIKDAYEIAQGMTFLCTIFLIILSAYIGQTDYGNWRAFITISPLIFFLAVLIFGVSLILVVRYYWWSDINYVFICFIIGFMATAIVWIYFCRNKRHEFFNKFCCEGKELPISEVLAQLYHAIDLNKPPKTEFTSAINKVNKLFHDNGEYLKAIIKVEHKFNTFCIINKLDNEHVNLLIKFRAYIDFKEHCTRF